MRSSWVIPVAGILGALTLGLAGCGGGDNSPFPSPNNNQNPINVTPIGPQAAQAQIPVTRSGGGTLTGGGVTVTIPPNSVNTDTTIGVASIPNSQGTLNTTRLTNPNAGPGLTQIAEFQIGAVGGDGRINTSCTDGTITSFSVTLSQAQADMLRNMLGQGSLLQVRQVVGNQIVIVNGVSVSLSGNTALVTSANPMSICGDYLILAANPNHPQFDFGNNL